MLPKHFEAVVKLQRLCFPPPFSEDLHWDVECLEAHGKKFPKGQWVAMAGDQLVGSCSNCVISEGRWRGHQNWSQAVGGPFIEGFDPKGDTLYGMDIGVHPEFRKRGVGRAFYAKRFDFVKSNGLARYGTACRIPDYARYKEIAVESFVKGVVSGSFSDRTLSPLLRYGLRCLGVKKDYLEDEESSHNAALLLWLPEFEHDKEGDD